MFNPLSGIASTVRPVLRRAGVVAALILVPSTAALAQDRACVGRNLLDELKASDQPLFDEVRKAADKTINARNVLWKIEIPDKPERAPSYLFGTVRLTDDRLQVLPAAVTQAMLSARRIAVEIDDASPRRSNEAMKAMLPKVLDEGDHRLDKVLSAAELSKARPSLSRSTLPPDVLPRVRPWVANVMLATTDCERGRISAGKLPMDAEIARKAENRGVGTMGLETVELQFQALADVPDSDQLAVLKARLSIADRINDVTETMAQLYLKRDLGAIWPLQIALAKKAGLDPKSFESYQENLVSLRTKRMRDRAHIHLQRGGIFVVMDAQNLPGETGMVALLQELGYTVTAVE